MVSVRPSNKNTPKRYMGPGGSLSLQDMFLFFFITTWDRKNFFWPIRPRPHRWSLFSHVTKIKTLIQRTPWVKIMTVYWLGPGGSLWSLSTCSAFFSRETLGKMSDLFPGFFSPYSTLVDIHFLGGKGKSALFFSPERLILKREP